MSESLDVNRRHWDERAPVHAASPDYGIERFVADPAHLSSVVRFDLPLLGDVSGLRGVHLQCHIGTDTLSLTRLGARMSGLDFSPASIHQARLLAQRTHTPIDFVCAEVYAAPEALPVAEFDLVYTGIGALCWLPDIQRWAATVAALLRPGGRLFVREGHPMMWAMDDSRSDGTLLVDYPCGSMDEPIVFDEPGTYVQTDAILTETTSHSWNHGLGDILGAVLAAGLEITGFTEHRSLPWNAFDEGAMRLGDDDEWRLVQRPERLPLSYTLQARRS